MLKFVKLSILYIFIKPFTNHLQSNSKTRTSLEFVFTYLPKESIHEISFYPYVT